MDFDSRWNFDDPAATEAAFRDLLASKGAEMPEPRRAELMTQIARAVGLQGRFDEAHSALDDALPLAEGDPIALARCMLERGRAYNSEGHRERAAPYFERALDIVTHAQPSAKGAGGRTSDFYAVDALHMLAIVAPPEEQISLHDRAIQLAESSESTQTQGWLASLLNNRGWTLHDLGRFEEALLTFERALTLRLEQGDGGRARIAKWAIARCLRSMGNVEKALELQLDLEAECEAAGSPDGYVAQEIAECLEALGRGDEAIPYRARAAALMRP